MATTKSAPIRVFIGSSPRNAIEEAVFVYTLRKYASRPLEIFSINGKTGSVLNLETQSVKCLPTELIDNIPGATAFSLARWAIPEWCDYTGRAIYCDSDQISLSDISKLWDYDLADHTLAAVPFRQAKSKPGYKATMKGYLRGTGDYYLASVMLIDCERAKIWSLRKVVDWIEQQKGAGEVPDVMRLGENFRESFGVSVMPLPPEWNHLDWLDESTKILHFTDLTSQPWKFHHHQWSAFWEQNFLDALEHGSLTMSEVNAARNAGYVSERVRSLSSIPTVLRGPINRTWQTSVATVFLVTQFFSRCSDALLSLCRRAGSKAKRLLNVYS